jgi:hypothetical protein
VQVFNKTHLDLEGLIGITPHYDSLIWQAMNTSAGTTPVDRIFQQNSSTQGYVTILLTRTSDDTAGSDPIDQKGQFTIGTPIDGLENVMKQPKLPSLTDELGRSHWGIQLEDQSILGPDGQPISVRSGVNISEGSPRLRAAFDTGAELTFAPADVVHGIFGRVPGAVQSNSRRSFRTSGAFHATTS